MKTYLLSFLLLISTSFLISCDDKCDRNLYERYSSQLSTEMDAFIPYKVGDTLILKDSLGNRLTLVCNQREITMDTISTAVYDDGKLCYTDKEFRQVLKVNLAESAKSFSAKRIYFYCYIDNLKTGKYVKDLKSGEVVNFINYDTYAGGGKIYFNNFQDPCDGGVYLSCQDSVMANNILYRNVYVFGKDSRNDNHEYLFWDKRKGVVKLQSYSGAIWERVD